ncbi:MAG: CotH kinase family protein [Muribaculaceae bacterium]
MLFIKFIIFASLNLTYYYHEKIYFLFFLTIAVFEAIYALEPSGSLPVLVIDTENHQQIYSKENYINATYYLDPRGCDGVEAFGSAENPLALQIKGRGNYTWTFNKKPYRLKLDKKAALLGMESSKHFALMAHADDSRAFMRNLTGFEVSRMSGLPWTPADQPCEVILNGDYIGLYFLTETISLTRNALTSAILTIT